MANNNQLDVPSVTLIWALVAVFIFLTLIVSTIARMRWTRHLKADDVYRVTSQSSSNDNAVFADLVTSVKAMKSAANELFRAQATEMSSRFDRLTAENEQIKALLSIKMNDERGLVQAAFELVMNECAASQAFRVRQKRREAHIRHAAEAVKAALSNNPSPRLREAVNRLTRECTTTAAESVREVQRKYRIRNHASVIGNDAMNLIEANLENEVNAERKFHALLTSTLSSFENYNFSIMESEMERDDAIRVAHERRQQILVTQAQQMHTRHVNRANEVLSAAVNRLLTMLDSCVTELASARQARSDDEKATIALLEEQRTEAESRYETGLLAGLDSQLKQGIIQLIRHADTMITNLSDHNPTRNRTMSTIQQSQPSSTPTMTEAESLAARLITALGDPVAQGLESISAAINDVGLSCSASLNVFPASAWMQEIESTNASGNQVLASHNDAEREHVQLVMKMHRPTDLDEHEETRLDHAEEELYSAQDALLAAREKVLEENYQKHQKAIQNICNDLNEAETLRLQNISRIQNRIESLEQDITKGSTTEEDTQRLAELKAEQASAENELAEVRTQAQQSVIDAHSAWAINSRTAMQQASDRHKQMFAKAFQDYVKERSTIAERQRGLAAQADMEASDEICAQLRSIQTSEIVGDAEKMQESAIKRYHADALIDLTREHREQTRLAKEDLEQQRDGELDSAKELHDAQLESIRDELSRDVEALKAQVSDEIQRAAKEQELKKKSAKAEREAASSHRKQMKHINEDWSKRIDGELKGLFETQAGERAQEVGDQREELAQFHNSTRAKLEMALLSKTLNEANRDRAKPLIEAAVNSRHEDVRAQLEARQKREMIDRMRNTLLDNVKARQSAVSELQRARDAGEITVDKFNQSMMDIDREFDPSKVAKEVRTQLLTEAAKELKALRAAQAEEVRSIMSQLYPDEDFSGAEWQQVDNNALDELVANHLKQQKEEEEAMMRQLHEQRTKLLERQNQVAELVAQLEADCEARISNEVTQLEAHRNAKLEELDRTHWVAMQDLQDRLQNNQITPADFDAEVMKEQERAQSKAAQINAQCQSAVINKTEALRRECRSQQNALQVAEELPPVGAIVQEQQERNQKVNALLTETASALIARGQAVQSCRKAGITHAIALMTKMMRNLPARVESKPVPAESAGASSATGSLSNSDIHSSLDRIESLLSASKKASHNDRFVAIMSSLPPALVSIDRLPTAQRATRSLVQQYVNNCTREFGIPVMRFACTDTQLSELHFYPLQRCLVTNTSDLAHQSQLLTRLARAMCVIALPTPGVPRPNLDQQLDRAIAQLASLISVSASTVETSEEGSDSDDNWIEQQTSFLKRITQVQ